MEKEKEAPWEWKEGVEQKITGSTEWRELQTQQEEKARRRKIEMETIKK